MLLSNRTCVLLGWSFGIRATCFFQESDKSALSYYAQQPTVVDFARSPLSRKRESPGRRRSPRRRHCRELWRIPGRLSALGTSGCFGRHQRFHVAVPIALKSLAGIVDPFLLEKLRHLWDRPPRPAIAMPRSGRSERTIHPSPARRRTTLETCEPVRSRPVSDVGVNRLKMTQA